MADDKLLYQVYVLVDATPKEAADLSESLMDRANELGFVADISGAAPADSEREREATALLTEMIEPFRYPFAGSLSGELLDRVTAYLSARSETIRALARDRGGLGPRHTAGPDASPYPPP